MLDDTAPASVLVAGADARRRVAGWAGDPERIRMVPFGPEVDPAQTLEALSGAGRHALGILSAVDARGDLAALEPVIARLRDVHAQRLWVLWPHAAGPPDEHRDGLTALGLQGLAEYEADDGPVRVLAHDVATYKRTPDWLNPGGWAHPDRWDKQRW